MNRWLVARARAYQVRQQTEARVRRELYGEELINEIVENEELTCLELSANDPLLGGEDGYSRARYYASEGLIVVSRDLPDDLRTLYKTHELGHHFLHTRRVVWSTGEIDPGSLVLTLPYAEGRIADYSPYQLQENEATVFATELLVPSERLAKWFDSGQSASELSSKFQVSTYTVLSQMTNVLLVPPLDFEGILTQADNPPFHWQNLDDSQKEACCAPQGPVLVQAGPGTGKTRTLTSRIEWLIQERNVGPEHILALTFSNKATEELRFRLHQTMPEIAHQVTVSTFHGFGLELLRRYSDRVNLPLNFAVIDPIEGELLLEENLSELNLHYFSDPVIPDRYLSEILDEISRAKEELVSSADYLELVSAMEQGELNEQEREKVAKCREVGRVYEKYQALLQQKGLVDYGDLVMKPVLLLQDTPDLVNQLQHQYKHILVDEYQDINQASGRLVQLLAARGGIGLWAVGDLRQSIYRWRGASPTYIRRFNQYYPDAVVYSLEVNYRAFEQLVTLVGQVAAQMSLPLTTLGWKSAKGSLSNSTIQVALATEKRSEWQGIADKIRQFINDGFEYQDIAILCRTNSHASEIAQTLASLEIPALHLGKFFFRREIKDLLAVLSLSAQENGIPWLRVVTLIREPVPVQKAVEMWQQAREYTPLFPSIVITIDGSELTPKQNEDLRHLVDIIAPYVSTLKSSPWLLLAEFLFEFGHYLRGLRLCSSLEKNQLLLAIAQLLNLAKAFERSSPFGVESNPIKVFMQHVRHLVKRDDNDVNLPISEVDTEAVYVLTIHKAKGLEFPIVFVPNLADRRFPPQAWRNQMVPRVEGLVKDVELNGETLEEESCLFVAISRAQKHLVLSRAESYEQRKGKPVSRKKSELWNILDPALNGLGVNPLVARWDRPLEIVSRSKIWQEVTPAHLIAMSARLDLRAVRIFQRCPRQFFYRYVLGLAVQDERDIYLQFHQVIHQVANWLRISLSDGKFPDWETVLGQLEKEFQQNIPEEYVHTSWYRQQAEEQLKTLWAHFQTNEYQAMNLYYNLPTKVDINGMLLEFQVDEILEKQDRLIVTSYRTGRPFKSHLEDTSLALYRTAAKSRIDKQVQIQLYYLSTGEIVEVPADKDEKILQALNQDIEWIREGYYPPEPQYNRYWQICASCSYLLLCPRGEQE